MADRQELLFAEIYREHLGILGRIAQAFAPAPSDRDELFQDMLVALWRACPQFAAESKLSTYVYRVALSCALNWKRSRIRYAERLAHFSRIPAPAETATTGGDRERLTWLYARIHELPPLDRTLVLLSLDRVAYGEIAAITGLSESNIGVRLHRIKQQLTAQLADVKHELR